MFYFSCYFCLYFLKEFFKPGISTKHFFSSVCRRCFEFLELQLQEWHTSSLERWVTSLELTFLIHFISSLSPFFSFLFCCNLIWGFTPKTQIPTMSQSRRTQQEIPWLGFSRRFMLTCVWKRDTSDALSPRPPPRADGGETRVSAAVPRECSYFHRSFPIHESHATQIRLTLKLKGADKRRKGFIKYLLNTFLIMGGEKKA